MSDQQGNVVITDIDISFGRLIVLGIKFGLAAIPAAIVIAIIWGVIVMVLGAIFGGFGMMTGMMGGLGN